MAVVPVYNCFHPVMRKKSEKVNNFEEVKELITNLFDTLDEIDNGVGLAAPQIGADKAVVVIDTMFEEEDDDSKDTKDEQEIEVGERIVLINPEIIDYSEDKEMAQEGCLSIPEFWEEVLRSKKIKVRYQDESMNTIEREVYGFLARVFQHEIDHLNGTLFVDRLTSLRKALSKSKLNKIAKGKILPKYDMIQADGSLTKGDSNE